MYLSKLFKTLTWKILIYFKEAKPLNMHRPVFLTLSTLRVPCLLLYLALPSTFHR